MEAELEAARTQIAEQAELQEVNEQLLAELEKRDQAVEEAVSLICSLEDKVERLMQDREDVRTFESQTQYDSHHFQDNHEEEISSSPPTFPDQRSTQRNTKARAIARMPSFLSEDSEGVDALRSLYLPSNLSHSNATLPKLLEEQTDGMNSPRLSVLSESSFMSIYGQKQLSSELEEEEEDTIQRRRKSSSVEKWIDERPGAAATPHTSPPLDKRRNQFLSMNYIAASPLQRLEKLKNNLQKQVQKSANLRIQSEAQQIDNVKEPRRPRDNLRRVVTDKISFEKTNLPPTPDTISTNTLRNFQRSNDTLHNQNEDDEPTIKITSKFPVPLATHNAYQSTLSIRPRSAGETVTSRREGHGWDTETQDDVTDTGSICSTVSTYDNQTNIYIPKRVKTPNLFMFGNGERDNSHEWSRDMMFNNDSVRAPPRSQEHTSRRYERLRRSSMVEPRSDDTVTAYKPIVHQPSDDRDHQLTTNGPVAPDRRSSLSAVAKLRKAPPPLINSSPASIVAPSAPTPTKKSRFAGKLFGRSEPAPVTAPPKQPLLQTQQPTRSRTAASAGRDTPQFLYDEDESARATPPPIARSRGQNNVQSDWRPRSAGEGAAVIRNSRRQLGYDGAGDEKETVINGHQRRGSIGVPTRPISGIEGTLTEEEGKTNTGGRKWFGLAKAGSLSRR